MLLQLLFCNVLFIPVIYGSNSTITNEPGSNKTVSSTEQAVLNNNYINNITLLSEGGVISSNASTLTLPKENHTTLIKFDKELGKTKSSHVVPRKRVQYDESDLTDFKENSVEQKKSNSTTHPNTTSAVPVVSVSKQDLHDGQKDQIEKKWKPQVLSSDKLSQLDQHTQSDQLIVSNADIKLQVLNSRHPGMIMPVIITILTVPLFAVLGYMALRRGQEAWKNRHYKRMDFLLDGMYND